MLSTVRTARAPPDLKTDFIRIEKRNDEHTHRRQGGKGVKDFEHLGTSELVFGRPRTGCAVDRFY